MLPLVNGEFETLTPYVPGKPVSETERELGITGVIKLASNENPLGPSPKAMEAVAAAIPSLHDYPDGGAFYLKQALADFHGVQPEQLVIGNGTNEVIEMVIRTCLRPDENLLYVQSSFIVYKLCTLSLGRSIKEVPLTNHRYDLDAVADAIDERTKLVFIANPNNPTGTYVTRDELKTFLKKIPDHVLVVLDEAYFEYVTAEDFPNGLQYLSDRERLMVTRTFSKCYGLAGLRIGYGISHAPLIDYINRGRQPFNCNTLAQVAALAALKDTEHLRRSRELNASEMTRVTPQLEALGLGVTPSQANFLLVDFHRDAGEVFQKLMKLGVIVRPMGGYGLTTCARITLGTESQNDTLLRVLPEALS
ncbi:MAG: histidinol-phosphate transaminase [Myxococcota bacterium]|nr:histidinol-phosphate transaminase [Myxococcota bacterium]